MRRYPFLPSDSDSDLGWTPYVWLIYLGSFFIQPIEDGFGPRGWAATLAVVAVFLPLYLRGYWGPRRAALSAVAIALLGVISSPWNSGGSVFFIYAAGYLGFAHDRRLALRWLGVLLIVVALEAWLFDLPVVYWIIGLVFTTLIGGINMHFAEVNRRNRALKLSQEEVRRLAEVAERERIGRDLHDLLGHTLSLITLKAELAGKLALRDPAAAAAEMAEVERTSRQALREVRQAVLGYRSEGLAAELERAEAALASAGIACRTEIEPLALSVDQQRVLAFSLREAVTNVLRHSAARECAVRLARRGGSVRLEVCDDGRGGASPEGAGLAGMRERAAALGGSVERDGDGGTRLTVILPLAAAEPRSGGDDAAMAGRSADEPDAEPAVAEASAVAEPLV